LRIFAECLRGVSVAFFCFLQFLGKSVLIEKVGGVAESASKNATYIRGRGEEYVETIKIIQFPWFLGVSVFDDDPKKIR
jgi:hypothetical protein